MSYRIRHCWVPISYIIAVLYLCFVFRIKGMKRNSVCEALLKSQILGKKFHLIKPFLLNWSVNQ